uniref:Trypsin-7 n=1 Tax=Lygus hesperus TaxID=30085 RepID=A0A0A9Z246_LYGHE
MKTLLFSVITGLLCLETGAIRGGSVTSLVYNPHLVSISIGEEFACAGSLLTLDWVVTVASCVQDIPIEKIKVRAGSWKTDGFGQVSDVDQALVHPMFNWYTQDYDLALVKVAKGFTKGPKVRPIQLAKDPVDVSQEATVVGWGENTEGQEGELRKLVVNLLTNDTCKDQLPYDIISPRMICSWVDSKSSPCWNDFGDPLKNKWGKLVGMYTYSRKCKSFPSVYTYLHPYREWIATAVPDLIIN